MNSLHLYLSVAFVLASLKGVESANILAITLVPSHSHHLWQSKYLNALLDRGHNVTYVGIERLKSARHNARHITFDKLVEAVFKDEDETQYTEVGPLEMMLMLDKWDYAVADQVKKSETFQHFLRTIKSDEFDLVVYDIALCSFILGAVDATNAPALIGITPFGRPSWILDVLENPVSYVSDPHSFLPYSKEMTFLQRFNNYLFHMISRGTRALYFIEQNKHAKDAFGDGIRPLEEILNQMHIVMVNEIEGIDNTYPSVPGLIPVGGLHIEKPKPLPQDLQKYLDTAEHGVIYFSLGTFITSSRLPKDKIDIINNAFKQLAPIKVLWKWEKEHLPGKPDNVKILKWMPQNDILAHPNVLLFFTHSGLLSVQEAIYHGVPILGMPFVLDQGINLKKCEERGIAESLNYKTLTSEAIVGKIKKILSEKKYKQNIKQLSSIFKDRLNEPLEKAVFWTEYAIRHKGASHLSVSARKLAWYQNSLLDIYLSLLSLVILSVFVVYKCLRYIVVRLRKGETKQKKF